VSFEDDLMRNFGAADRMTKIMERFGMEEGEELEHPWLNRSVETAQKRVEERNYLSRKRTLEYDDVMNKQREVVYGLRNEAIETENPRGMVYEIMDEALPVKVSTFLEADGAEPNYAGLLHWVNVTFPLGLTAERAHFENKTAAEATEFLKEQIKKSYELKCSHEEPLAVISLERYILLNAIDRLWQGHLYEMDGLREAVGLRAHAQKDPLVEYKNEAYEMFVELMASIKNEVLNNLFRSTSNLMAFEKFLSSLPDFLRRQEASTAENPAGQRPEPPAARALEPDPKSNIGISIPNKEPSKAGRNDPCPCGSGKKYKNCCGRQA
jgi:preprotein translocase subunit SecA